MADHFVGFSRGIQGFKASDFTTGAASTAGLNLEVRVFDSAGGLGMKRSEVINGLEAIIRFMENPQQTKAAGFVFLDG
jgi:hypothetical protein